MKPKGKVAPIQAKSRNKVDSEGDRRRVFQRRIWLRLAAVLLAIVFIASECATLLPVE